jgi:hypothetical protein
VHNEETFRCFSNTFFLRFGHGSDAGSAGQVKPGGKAVHQAYLFAHIMEGDYGHLYYSVSLDGLDGLHWTLLNGGRRVFEDYRGHPISAAAMIIVITSLGIAATTSRTLTSGCRRI